MDSHAAGIFFRSEFSSVKRRRLCRIERLYRAVPVRLRLSAREALIPQSPKWANIKWNDSKQDSPLLDMCSFNWCGEFGLGRITSYICSSGKGSCIKEAFSLQFCTAAFVSEEKRVSPVTGSHLPLAGREASLDEEHLNLSNQSSSMAHKTCGGLVSFHKHRSCLCRNNFVDLSSMISSVVCFFDTNVPSFNAFKRFS